MSPGHNTKESDRQRQAAAGTKRNEIPAEEGQDDGSPAKLSPTGLVLLMIYFYQKAISPWFPPVCRFTPTCSDYAITALKKYGILRGGVLIIWRILRCQPFCKGGFDPVPELKHWKRHRKKHNKELK